MLHTMCIMMKSIKCCKLYVIFYTCILTSVILGIPLKSIDEKFTSDKVTNVIKYNGGDGGIDVTNDNQLHANGVYAADDNRLQADGIGVENATVRIKVTVTKRSRRFWEPWELNRGKCLMY